MLDTCCSPAREGKTHRARHLPESSQGRAQSGRGLRQRLSSQYAGVPKVMRECKDQLQTCAVQRMCPAFSAKWEGVSYWGLGAMLLGLPSLQG